MPQEKNNGISPLFYLLVSQQKATEAASGKLILAGVPRFRVF